MILNMSLFKKENNVMVEISKEPTMVSCRDCKCLLYENDAQKIIVDIKFPTSNNILVDIKFPTSNNILDDISNKKIYRYYCNTHRRNYEKVSNFFTEEIYFKEMQVDENGEPIGYKKIKSNE